jgi:hypothetical protein
VKRRKQRGEPQAASLFCFSTNPQPPTPQKILEAIKSDGTRFFASLRMTICRLVILSEAKNLVVGWLLDLSHHFLSLTKIFSDFFVSSPFGESLERLAR